MDALPERVGLDDFNTIPDMSDFRHNGDAPEPALQLVELAQFAATTEDVLEPLAGTPDDALLPAGGTLLMYGDGGAGKTTLSIDAMAHLASGTDWLGITIAKPLRILLIENEGPRGPFRKRLQQKIDQWPGEPFHPQVVVLQEPWTRFTITNPSHRLELSTEIANHTIDLVIVGPLASLGAKGTGTPDEVNEFDEHIRQLREHTDRPFGLWIVHHENKAGDVSGAWERYPDTLVHVQAQGNGRTGVYWRKVRWGSELHGTRTDLVWADGYGYTIDEPHERDYRHDILNALTDGEWHMKTKLSRDELNTDWKMLEAPMRRLIDEGEVEYQQGAIGAKNSHCYRLKSAYDEARRKPSQASLADDPEGWPKGAYDTTPPLGGVGVVVSNRHPDGADDNPVVSKQPTNPVNDDSDIPF